MAKAKAKSLPDYLDPAILENSRIVRGNDLNEFIVFNVNGNIGVSITYRRSIGDGFCPSVSATAEFTDDDGVEMRVNMHSETLRLDLKQLSEHPFVKFWNAASDAEFEQRESNRSKGYDRMKEVLKID